MRVVALSLVVLWCFSWVSLWADTSDTLTTLELIDRLELNLERQRIELNGLKLELAKQEKFLNSLETNYAQRGQIISDLRMRVRWKESSIFLLESRIAKLESELSASKDSTREARSLLIESERESKIKQIKTGILLFLVGLLAGATGGVLTAR